MVFLYILLAISLIALVFLGVVVFKGGSKNSKSFQAELARRNAKKASKTLATDFIEGKLSFDDLSQKITNPNTLKRIKTNADKLNTLTLELNNYNKEYESLSKRSLELTKYSQKLKSENSNKLEKTLSELKEVKLSLAKVIKEIRLAESSIKQLKFDIKMIITTYSYGAQTGSSLEKLTRNERKEEKTVLKAAMKEKKLAWKKEDEEYYALVKENILKLKEEVKLSKIKLEELKQKYLEEKKKNELLEKETTTNTPSDSPSVAPDDTQAEQAAEGINYSAIEAEDLDPAHACEREYREYLKEHERLLQKYRIEKERISLTRRLERWSKRGGHLRREIFVKRQYYYLVAPYTILFFLFTVVPVLMSLYLSFTYFNLLEFPTFNGWSNYMRLFVDDKVFIIAIRNTAILAVITGPLSYLMAFVFAWLINELKPLARSIMTLIFYAPSISGNVYLVWKLIFSSDIYGYANAFLLKLNIIKEPITWLQDAKYIIWILIIVQLWLSLGVSFLAFIAGLQSVNRELYEAGAIDGIKNRWQELWFITLPQMKSQLLFGAVMQITSSLAVAEVSTQIAGFPSIEYAGHTIITHLMDYGSVRMEMGYASAIATILFIIMIAANLLVRKILRRVGS